MSTPLTKAQAFEAFRSWAAALLSPTVSEVWEQNQAEALAQRPDLPYATVRWLRSRRLSTAPRTYVGDEVAPGDPDGLTHERFVQYVRQGVVQLVVYGDGANDLIESMALLKSQHDSIKDLHDKRIAVHPLGDVLDLPELRDLHYEPIASQEWGVVYTTEHEGRTGILETLDTSSVSILPTKE